MQKKVQLILKTPLALFNTQKQRKKSFYENVSDLTSFFFFEYIFFMSLIPMILFPETLLAACICYE